ncbi:MAG: tetratricopeptide repeat protein, partial [Crinalium sp.]
SYKSLIEITPLNPQAYYKLAAALRKDNRKPEAIAALEKARDLYRSQGQSEGVQKAESALRELKPSS